MQTERSCKSKIKQNGAGGSRGRSPHQHQRKMNGFECPSQQSQHRKTKCCGNEQFERENFNENDHRPF
jgi:hypothetical protein